MSVDPKLINEYNNFYTILDKTIGRYSQEEYKKARDPYSSLRNSILSNKEIREKMPSFILSCQTLDDFSGFIRSKCGSNEDRRIYLKKAFGPANAFFHNISATPSDEVVSATLMPRKNLMDTWEKALQRRATDPDGAITSARTLLESTFKHVLDEKGISYSDDGDLQPLYELASNAINLHPSQHSSNPGLQQL
jgi:hypothetical protein